ncbi:MAG: hypothetical protein V3T18_06455, partial [Pseudomonadales bacterium]
VKPHRVIEARYLHGFTLHRAAMWQACGGQQRIVGFINSQALVHSRLVTGVAVGLEPDVLLGLLRYI